MMIFFKMNAQNLPLPWKGKYFTLSPCSNHNRENSIFPKLIKEVLSHPA